VTLKLKTTTRRAVFSYESDGMAVSWELRPEDDGPAVIAKLERMLQFLHRERVAALPLPLAGPVPQLPRSGYITDQPPVGAASGVGTLMQQGLQQAKQFTGVPPVQPVPLQESIAKAAASGWELYTKEELANG